MTNGLLMPDGSIRPVPLYWSKPQSSWTEEERAQAAADQQEHIAMVKRLADQEGAKPNSVTG